MNRWRMLLAAVTIAAPTVMYYEGEELSAYWDSHGKITTICYGHTKTAKMGQRKTPEECTKLLLTELHEYAVEVDRLVHVDVHPNTLAALVSFSYNLGTPTLAKSTVLKRINAGNIRGGCDFMRKYIYSGGKVLKGLIKRREAERELCLSF